MTIPRVPNPKRRVRGGVLSQAEREALHALAAAARYGGNPMHKRSPGDFGLVPPASPRQGKTLCDGAGILDRATAEELLREGIRRGMVSIQQRNGWPQNVWAVTPSGIPLEAMLDNEQTGNYHGYPLLGHDPLWDEILRRWSPP